MPMQIWKQVGEKFDLTLPRPTAVCVKENDYNLAFYYPALESRMSYCFDSTIITMCDVQPRFKIEFMGEYFPNFAENCAENRTLLSNQTTYPGLIRSDFAFMNVGLKGTQWFGQKYEDSLTWYAKFDSLHSTCCRFRKMLVTTVSSDEGFEVSVLDGGVMLTFDGFTQYIACSRPTEIFGADTLRGLRAAVKAGDASVPAGKIYVLGLGVSYNEAPDFSADLTFGLSTVSMAHAIKALDASEIEETISAKYDKWFDSLPVVGNLSDREKLAYYKTWAVIRANYYQHPEWGFSVMESFPVFKGIWQAGVSAVEWHSDQNPEDNAAWITTAMDMLVDNQRDDGYITHAIYIDEDPPGSRWSMRDGVGAIQQPCIVWSALRHYHITGDLDSLKKWYPAFKCYYDYITRTRDTGLRSLHLWGIFSAFDVGVDTTAAYLRCTHDEDGISERYCYPAIFAAERIRYEQSMAEAAEILGLPEEADFWTQESAKTAEAADKYLWDETKGWYGVLHEDETLDTRVGIDGLLMLAYGLVSPERAAEMETGFRKLLGTYGVRSVAADEKGFISNNLWYGPSWPWTLAAGMAAAKNYYAHLVEETYEGLLNFILMYPSIWEAMDVDTGEAARKSEGNLVTPGMTTNTGAGELLGALLLYRDIPMYDREMTLPMQHSIRNLHYKGMRISVTPSDDGCRITATAAEQTAAEVTFTNGHEKYTLQLKDGETICIK